MPTKFLIPNTDDAIFTPMIGYHTYKNRGVNPPRIGGRTFKLGSPGLGLAPAGPGGGGRPEASREQAPRSDARRERRRMELGREPAA